MPETHDQWDAVKDHAELVEAIEELALLWPALLSAVERDRGVPSGERVTTSSQVLTVPLNVDVLAALADLRARLGAPGNLPGLPKRFDRLLATNAADAARQLARDVAESRKVARRAVGLSVPNRPLGRYCPRHDEPLVELVVPGDQGRLVWRGRDPAGRPVGLSVVWTHLDVVECPHRRCGARWTPAQQMWLRRLMRDADARRLAAGGPG